MRPQPTRRTLVAGLVALTAAGCSGATRTASLPSAGRGAVAAADDGRSGSRVMQILAHPDDDLYFMNPEVQQTIGANDQLVSVYLNCGETGGVNKVPGRPKPEPNLAAYAGARRQGLRQAYALMATGDPHAGWGMQALALPDGTLIEVNTLAGHTGVQLIFLGVHQHFAVGRGRKRGLPDLWADPAMVTSTLVSTGSPVRRSQKITRSGLIDVLVQLLDRYRPTLVRTLDPDPDMQVHDGAHRRHHDQAGYSDHPDHTAAALFTYAALARYKGPGEGRLHAVMAYRGYYNERWPDNLPAQLVRDKAVALNAYGGAPDSCDFPAGCGDYDVGRNRSYRTGWLQRTSLRYPTAAPQVRQGPDGRLTAFAVLAGQAVRWQQTGKGDGSWTTPEPLGGNGLLPGLSATLTEDGRWQLFAERIAALGPKAADNRREIVMAEQPRPGGPFRPWTSLGTPDRIPDHGRRVGGPVVARDADGTTWLFARNWAKGVSARQRRGDGTWSDWADLEPAEVQEGLSAVTDGKGCVHVFGSGHNTVHHWQQEHPGGRFFLRRTGLPSPADPPTALARPDGSLLLAFREAKSARPLVHRLPVGGATWQGERVGLVARGYGVLALHPVAGDVLLAAGNNDGTTSLATLGAGHAPRWQTLTGAVVGAAALATDAAGRPVLARLAPNATLTTSLVPQNRR
ncbi:PIG-L family deacetylase [Streptomyces sp. A1-5]|uniref:PIG-L family deacetylase n=1 Tax=Streptomyces sp. A1-5 TaxID=2738410 RepID=UPI001F48EFFA|nr:PIG-L family deacetylase [Streptomyces sp. A1-5]UJB41717.1 PIG-L family deacetylase [Streptomyces sp. A1-5]